MPRNIIILLDGTSNQIAENRTNILRLYGTLEKSERQIVYYDPGVGTLGAEDSWLSYWRKAVEIWGLATGWGLDHKVKQAYAFLVQNYRHGNGADKPGDNIYIFGFSRGAYCARMLAGFIRAVGLIEPRNLNLLDYAYRAYKRIGEGNEASEKVHPGDRNKAFAEVRLYERVLRTGRPPIRLLGLFDTVSSVIEMGRYLPQLRSHAFTRKNDSVESVRHAVAIDERRTMFRPQLWLTAGTFRSDLFKPCTEVKQDIREVWFSGTHCDIGGGYPERESQLAKTVLMWMIRQTRPMGLHYLDDVIGDLVMGARPGSKYQRPNGKSDPHDSMNWAWAILEFLPRRKPAGSRRPSLFGWSIPFFERRRIPAGALIWHEALGRAAPFGNLPQHAVPELQHPEPQQE